MKMLISGKADAFGRYILFIGILGTILSAWNIA